jgi:DUF1680 family protein
MFLMTGDGKYMDVLERTLYNGMIAGVSLSGDRFFYPNPLASDGEHPFNMGSCTRSPWFDCSCCPSNVTRFVPSIPGYIYATGDDELYVNLFIGSSSKIGVSGTEVGVRQYTTYPWENRITIELAPERPVAFDLKIRIPGWAGNQVLPGDLYHYVDAPPGLVSLNVNDEQIPAEAINGYCSIQRSWSKGDIIELELPMGFRRVAANERVKADSGKIAVEYPPLVYCAEQEDNSVDIFSVITIPEQSMIESTYQRSMLGGIRTITVDVPYKITNDQSADTRLKLIPYYAWSNRGEGRMTVWFPAEEQHDQSNH